MTPALFEHINITVTNPERTAKMLCDLFDWKIRWKGGSIHDGQSVHVGTEDRYIALYAHPDQSPPEGESYYRTGAVNHLGVLVGDLNAVERRIKAAGLETHSHQTYDPGSRFYFYDEDGIEYEVVSYA